MLRGPQTVGELRTRTERMHRFEDTDQVEYAMAVSLAVFCKATARHPGIKEPRWAQFLSGEPGGWRNDERQEPALRRAKIALATLESQVTQLTAEVSTLRDQLSELLNTHVTSPLDFTSRTFDSAASRPRTLHYTGNEPFHQSLRRRLT